MPEGPRALFIYYRVSLADARTIHDAIASFQTQLMTSDAAWHAQIWVRHDENKTTDVTIMEVYEHDQGVNAEREAWLNDAIAEINMAGMGRRHIEAFQKSGGVPCA